MMCELYIWYNTQKGKAIEKERQRGKKERIKPSPESSVSSTSHIMPLPTSSSPALSASNDNDCKLFTWFTRVMHVLGPAYLNISHHFCSISSFWLPSRHTDVFLLENIKRILTEVLVICSSLWVEHCSARTLPQEGPQPIITISVQIPTLLLDHAS